MVTKISSGVASNVIPQHGELTVNMRTLAGQGGDAPLRYLTQRIAQTGWQRFVQVTPVEVNEPSQVSGVCSEATGSHSVPILAPLR